MNYEVKKCYGHEQGLSVCFRQHRAASHCHLLHGYAIAVEITFTSDTLDRNGWVIDFGSLKPIKQFLTDTFDHKLLVAQDDPQIDELCALGGLGLADVLVIPRIGCEAFAALIFRFVEQFLVETNQSNRVGIVQVEVKEHAGNSASFFGDYHG